MEGQYNWGSTILTSDRSYIIASNTASNDGDVTKNHGALDAWIVKLSALGSISWQKSFGGSGYDFANSILETSNGGYVFAGVTSSNDGDVSGYHLGHSGSVYTYQDTTDVWVVKLDPNGNMQWQKCLGGSGADDAASIIQTSDGGYIVAGETTTSDEGWFNHGDYDALVIKLDSLGNERWHKLYGGTSYDGASSILQTSDGGYIFVGVTYSNDGDVSGFHGNPTDAHVDVWVVKLDSNGSIQWQKCYGGTGSDWGWKIISIAGGKYVIAGSTASSDGNVVGYHPGVKNSSDAWIIEIDSVGTMLWQKCLGGSSWDVANSILHTPEGGFVFCGLTMSHDGDVSGKRGLNDSNDVWVVGLSGSGELQWQKCFGGLGNDQAYSIISTLDKGYLVSGITNSNDGDVSGNHGLYDVWVIKLSPFVNSVEDGVGGSSNFLNPYPNPSYETVHLEIYHSDPPKQIQFFNSLGAQCFPDYRVDGTTLSVDAHTLPAGLFVIRITYPNTALEEVRKFMHYN